MPDTTSEIRLYEDDADNLLRPESFPDRVSLLPSDPAPVSPNARLRLMWGQHMLRDVLDGRYRAVVCGVNTEDNSHGIIAQLVNTVSASQWTERSVTSYARLFEQSVAMHAAHDNEPYILKYDLDSVLVLALLRPKGRDHFTLADLGRGFATVAKMLAGREERLPVCTVSFNGARSNRLIAGDGARPEDEPSFERVLRTMHESGFRGDVYPSPRLWARGNVGVFASYPFSAGLERMRQGSS